LYIKLKILVIEIKETIQRKRKSERSEPKDNEEKENETKENNPKKTTQS